MKTNVFAALVLASLSGCGTNPPPAPTPATPAPATSETTAAADPVPSAAPATASASASASASATPAANVINVSDSDAGKTITAKTGDFIVFELFPGEDATKGYKYVVALSSKTLGKPAEEAPAAPAKIPQQVFRVDTGKTGPLSPVGTHVFEFALVKTGDDPAKAKKKLKFTIDVAK